MATVTKVSQPYLQLGLVDPLKKLNKTRDDALADYFLYRRVALCMGHAAQTVLQIKRSRKRSFRFSKAFSPIESSFLN